MNAMSRSVFGAVLVVGLLSSPAWAQEGLRSASLPERNLADPDVSTPVDLVCAGLRAYPPPNDPRCRPDRRPLGLPHFPYGSFVAPWWPYYGPFEVPFQELGYLLPRVTPGTAEVIVDGLYMGSVDDVRRTGRGQPLEPGPHRLDLRAPGYDPVTVGVQIASGETNHYQRDLEMTPRPPAPPPPPGVPKTFYVIPGCYAGDRPPETGRLPPKCDAAQARTIPPQVSSVRVTGSSPPAGR